MIRKQDRIPAAAAVIALLLGGCVYLVARPVSLFYMGGDFAVPLIGQLPSFGHTLAFALVSALVVDYCKSAVIWSWGVVAVLGEIAQHESFPVPQWLVAYQEASTFDRLDLLAVAAAIAAALLLTKTAAAHRLDRKINS